MTLGLAALSAVAWPALAASASASATAVPAKAPGGGVWLQSAGNGNAPLAAGQCSTPSNVMLPGIPWTRKRLAPERVWPITTGTGVIVAVIDTGVDASVPQFAGHVLPGMDVVNGSGPADNDCYGHGTFVAGIIASQAPAGTGVAGIAPGVTILPIRQANGANDGTASGWPEASGWRPTPAPRSVNISASSFPPSEELRGRQVRDGA